MSDLSDYKRHVVDPLEKRLGEVCAERDALKARVVQLEAAVDALLGFEHVQDCGSESGTWQSAGLEEAFKKAKEARAK